MFAILFLALAVGVQCNFEVIHEWKVLEYDWRSLEQKDEALKDGTFIPENNALTGVKVHKGEVYVTVPRWFNGVPSTLNKVIVKNGTSLLQPYPSWEMQRQGDPNALQYVQSMEIDNRGWMWILDVGQLNTDIPELKLIIWDIVANCSIREFVFPNDVLPWNNSFANDLAVDQRRGFAYISNTVAEGGIIVYDFNRNIARLFTDFNSMSGDPHGHVIINGVPMDISLGTDGIAISAKGDMLYYCSISRDTLFGIPTLYLRQNPPLPSSELAKRVIYLGKKAFSDGMTHDRYTNGFLVADEFSESLLIYGDYVNGAVYSWDTNSDLSTATKIAWNSTTMHWPDTFAWDDDIQSLYFSSNRLNLFLAKKMNFYTGDANFRIWSLPINKTSYFRATKPIPENLWCDVK